MDKELRIKKLQEIQADKENIYMTGIRIKYKGDPKIFNAYKIPLDYLIYNKHNGRIGSSVKSFEKQYRELNSEIEIDKKIIEDFLWKSKADRNKITMKSLVENHQQRYGIVTNDGTIIDGNRRASLLNKIYTNRTSWIDKDVDHCQYFIAVILPQGADKKEIIKLETSYQMGEDEKLDYNPIEKYLKCDDLVKAGFSAEDISKMMAEKESKINEWLSIFKLMESYLDNFGYQGIYTRLEKREGQFVDLNNYLTKYKKRTKTGASWGYTDSDVADLEVICFDYIRSQYEGKDFRNIAKTGNNENASIFCNETIWKPFSQKHFEEVDNILEKPIQEIREEDPEGDLSRQLKERDELWKNTAHNVLENNLRYYTRKLEDSKESKEPLKLLKKAKDALNYIDTDIDCFYTKEAKELIYEINSITYEFKKKLKSRVSS
ncbi:hypothetical protein SH1V18_34670 [Vallitalea longa]|uniref:Uncharacterized protein n=1 Tax=Vallitalea longa TaxID=2936439 RepID=A0A9W5YCK1_9FIRM|nr:hypothetical protein [Vallitalea longa]GKX30987.1 hypothetical protein SH1V18_34670 [Vallitalea longa]